MAGPKTPPRVEAHTHTLKDPPRLFTSSQVGVKVCTELLYTVKDDTVTDLSCGLWTECRPGCEKCLEGLDSQIHVEFQPGTLGESNEQHFREDLTQCTDQVISHLLNPEMEKLCTRPGSNTIIIAKAFHNLALVSCRAANTNVGEVLPYFRPDQEDLSQRSIYATYLTDSSHHPEKTLIYVSWQDYYEESLHLTDRYVDWKNITGDEIASLHSSILARNLPSARP